MAATYAGPPLANGLQPLSCLRCAHRKPKTEKRQRRKVAVASPSSRNKLRLGCDRYKDVKALSVDVDTIPDTLQGTITHSPRRNKTPLRETVDAAAAPNGQLIVMGKRSRYVEGDLWTRIVQELNTGDIFPDSSSDEEDDEEVASDTSAGYKASALALRLSPQTPPIASYYPTKQHFRILWPIYLSNIHPVTMILHAPSTGEILTKAVEGHGHTSKNAESLILAILMCALTSITDAECTRLLGQEKAVLLSRYRRGCEIALDKANYLMSCNIGVLQAYTLYLVAIGPYVDPCELWNLTGIAKRNAQRLGLQQEVPAAGLTPFEVEMRRRLWSQIVMHDTISAQNAGFHWSDIDCNIIAPSNVNDVDLSLSMKHSPAQRAGATDMIFCNLRHKVMKFMGQVNGGQRPWALAAGEKWTSATDQLYRMEREKAVAEMEEELELEFLRYCDMLKPVHFLTVIVARLSLCKLRYAILAPCQHGKNGSDCTGKDRDAMFTAALKVLEYENNASSQPSIQCFLWHTHQHFTWSCLIDILEILKTQPRNEQVDKAWEQIHMFYDVCPNLPQNSRSTPPLYRVVNKMVVEAWRVRETEASERGEVLVSPKYITTLREQDHGTKATTQAEDLQRSSTSSVSHTIRDQLTNQEPLLVSGGFGQGSTSWPNWADLSIAGSRLTGNDMNLLDPALGQGGHTSLVGHNYNLQLPQNPILPLDQYVACGWGGT
ncbi:hypothetical protein BDV38DRAFT_280119 [Aspergillus pseudotamarii]|uniref:Xylanolytic transcriptional activator regulatory domain-containing protein n=1 Tax=Aspergillus pseudotamarii TaxID=132259 RepID=A0A5N6T2U0_ASPPS|nr:uncharacterized protein BDV38DRAFT_280119 [Aspergillus pseudotamarii]KAE8140626.1 hypothetical protein BDV38DRAFT_280119 [Aspergillus pseudotamarii]